MDIYCLQHVPFEGPAAIEGVLRDFGLPLRRVHLYRGDPPPPPNRPDALIVMGGPMGVFDEAAHPWLANEKRFLRAALERDIPVLGICLGAQMLADAMGAVIRRNPQPEIGWFPVTRHSQAEKCELGRQLPDHMTVFHWHGDTFELPNGAVPLYRSQACLNQGFVADERFVGLQFHFEMTPPAVAELVRHGAKDLIDAPFVQKAPQLLADNAPYRENQIALNRLLSIWLGL